MRYIRKTSLFSVALLAAALATGCSSGGLDDILGNDRANDRNVTGDVRGTVERVDTLDRRIIVESEGTDRYNLRNEGDEVVLYYDDSTRVVHGGRTYEPEDLERGDRILADVNRSGDRLIAEEIEVLQDVSRGGTRDGDDRTAGELRGTVRYVDTRSRTLEIEPRSGSGYDTGRSGVVVVHYETGTTVEFEGRRYQPENLERGDEVEIEIRDVNGRLIAEDILVLADARSR